MTFCATWQAPIAEREAALAAAWEGAGGAFADTIAWKRGINMAAPRTQPALA